MPFYIRARQQDIPTPTISSVGSDDEDNFVTDPGQIFDELPQPFRLVDKTLNEIFEISWEQISALEEARELAKRQVKPPCHLPSSIFVANGITCGCAVSKDLLIVGTNHAILVLNPETQEELSSWSPEEEICIEQMKCAFSNHLGMYVVAVIDDMGFAKLLLYENNMFHFICCLNEMVEGVPRSNAVKIELSEDGYFLAAAYTCEGSSWADVFKLPLDTWFREVENARKEFAKKAESMTSQLQEEGTAESGSLQESSSDLAFPTIKFSQLIPNLKVPQPSGVVPRPYKTPQEMLEDVGGPEVIGDGSCHVMTEKFFGVQDKLFEFLNEDNLQYGEEEPTISKETKPSFHFLHPSRMEPSMQNKSESTYGFIAVWWSDHHNLYIYQLNKTGKTVEFKSDSVWPMPSNITSVTVGDNSRYLAIGTEAGDVSLWDRTLGTVCRVVHVADQSAVSDILFLRVNKKEGSHHHFILPTQVSVSVSLLVGTAKGEIALFNYPSNEEPTVVTPAAKTSDEKYALIKAIPCLPQSFILIKRDGSISLISVDEGHTQCTFALPEDFQYEHPLEAGSFLDRTGENLYIRGSTLSSPDSNTLFAFNLASRFTAMPKEEDQETRDASQGFADTVQSLLSQRMQKQASRTTVLASRWHNLNKQLDFVLNLKETMTARKKENRYSQSSSSASRWSKTTTKIIAHNKDLKV